jgi:tRNA(Arg) A34 adenosine deaminase TadA
VLNDNYLYMTEAIKEAKKSLMVGGIPIGAVIVEDNAIIGRGHNKLLQENSAILHAEMDCIENAGRLRGSDYKKCTLYTTLSPCEMCTGAIILYKIPRVVIGQNETLKGPENSLIDAGVELINMDLYESKEILEDYIKQNLDLWEDEIERIHE